MALLEDTNMSSYHIVKSVDGNNLEHLIYRIARWAEDRNITAEGGATSYSQLRKLREEVDEFEKAETEEEAILEFGDILVVCLQIARLRGIDIDDALGEAYMKIRDRKGRMENGVFVKQVE